MKKMNADSVADLVKMAVRLGLAPAKKSMERRARVIVSVDVSHWKTVRAPARLV